MPVFPLRTLVLAGAFTLSAIGAAQPALAAEPVQPFISVNGTGQASVAPDIAWVTLSVAETRKTAKEALDQSSQTMASVLKALAKDGVAGKDMQTSAFSIIQQYAYPQNDDGTPKPPVLTGYTVTQTLTVRLREIDKLGGILDEAVTLGINQGGDVRFDNADPKAVLEKARTAAVKDAVAKAETLANAAGVKLGPVLEIEESAGQYDPQPMMKSAMAAEAAPVPVATGENSYSVNVTMKFAIDGK